MFNKTYRQYTKTPALSWKGTHPARLEWVHSEERNKNRGCSRCVGYKERRGPQMASFKNSNFSIHHGLFFELQNPRAAIKTFASVRALSSYLTAKNIKKQNKNPKTSKIHKRRQAWCEAGNTNIPRRQGAESQTGAQGSKQAFLSYYPSVDCPIWTHL